MANKVKEMKKKSRRLKRTVRKTLGTIFLVTALVIGAIPVDGLQAADENEGIATFADDNREVIIETVPTDGTAPYIPQMDENTKIYTSADKLLRFVYLTDSDGVQGAVIVGYAAANLSGNSLDFTKPVDAYGQYRNNSATERNLVAVGKNGNFLFYRKPVTRVLKILNDGTGDLPEEPKYKVVGTDTNRTYYEYVSESPITNDAGQTIGKNVTVKVESGEFFPCYLDDYNEWFPIEGNVSQNLYYDANDAKGENPGRNPAEDNSKPFDYKKADTQTYQRLTGIPITYISNQYTTVTADGTWKYGGRVTSQGEKSKGIFAGNQNILNLKVSENLKGIGDYAFYNSGLTEITLSNGMKYIGTGAFENCLSLKTANLDVNSNLRMLGAYAFRNCQSLTRFILPIGVEQIGDSAFENCIAMYEIDLCSGENPNHLTTLGRTVFKNCGSLKSLTFPNNCSEAVYMSTFQGCTSLEWISARNRQIKFLDEPEVFTYEQFKAQVTDEFYFEGIGVYPPSWEYAETTPESSWDSMVHYIAWKYNFAFSYLQYRSTADGGVEYYKLNHYELTVSEKNDLGGEVGKNTFIVNNANELEMYIPWGKVTSLSIPNKIGKQSIETITAGVFENMCNLQKVSIPQTVKAIKTNAFRGCHNLTNVIFESGNITIENDAFKTQEFMLGAGDHMETCPSKEVEANTDPNSPDYNAPLQKLHFTGPIASDSAPFNYAMSEAGRYNASQGQKESYIIYYSGLPQNLQVEYDPVQKKSVLTDFPSLNELGNNKYTSSAYTYLGANYATEAIKAVEQYLANGNTNGMTEDQRKMIESALNIVIPDGVQAVKPGLFKDKEDANHDKIVGSAAAATYGMTVTAFSLEKIESGEEVVDEDSGDIRIKDGTGTFAGCQYLTSVTLNNDTAHPVAIEKHAFWECSNLENVSMANVSNLGVRPFAGCEKLADINFQNSTKYICDNSIIFEKDASGNKYKVVECLEGRPTKYVNSEELTGIAQLADEAFMGCEELRSVDLTTSTITEVSTRAFADTKGMRDILLPESCMSFKDYAFKDSGVEFLSIPYPERSIITTPNAFDGLDNVQTAIGCVEGSFIHDWFDRNGFETLPPRVGKRVYTVTFRDYVNGLLVDVSSVQVEGGKYIREEDIPVPNGRTGMVFTGWQVSPGNEIKKGPFEISDNVTCTATYDVAGADYGKLTVSFRDEDGNLLRNVYVVSGTDVEEIDIPNAPAKEGYVFEGWDRPLKNITASFSTYPKYRALAGDECIVRYFVNGSLYHTTVVKIGDNAPNISVDGRTDVTWVPSLNNIVKDTDLTAVFGGATDPNNPDNPNNPDDPNNPNNPNKPNNGDGSGNNGGKLYALTVQDGSGSGSYLPGTQIIVRANDPAKGQTFSSWTVSPEDTVVTDKTLSSIIITMPDHDVAVIANYKASSSTENGGNNNKPNGSGNGNNPSSGTISNGTTVVIDKNGLSNTGVVSATVNGSSDNFTIKITENSSATEAVLKALQAEYGSLDHVKYFPMDISLYDSTGTRKITDTRGLSISITLPLPDSLIAYAGNNKVAGVVNDKLDKLTPKFTTINGVSCVTFTAEHFSPYVIYVDVTNLSDGTTADSTPKTADGIHPKWFLVMGFASLSFVMFMMKDGGTKGKKKQKVAVRA